MTQQNCGGGKYKVNIFGVCHLYFGLQRLNIEILRYFCVFSSTTSFGNTKGWGMIMFFSPFQSVGRVLKLALWSLLYKKTACANSLSPPPLSPSLLTVSALHFVLCGFFLLPLCYVNSTKCKTYSGVCLKLSTSNSTTPTIKLKSMCLLIHAASPIKKKKKKRSLPK